MSKGKENIEEAIKGHVILDTMLRCYKNSSLGEDLQQTRSDDEIIHCTLHINMFKSATLILMDNFTNKSENSILSKPASAQKSFCEAASITKPFGHFSCPRTIGLGLLPSKLARAIFGVLPQSVQYINLESKEISVF